jgi:hypothetical protein
VILFTVGVAFAFGFEVWRTGGLWQGEREHAATTAVLYLPTVAGSFVTAITPAAVGYADWGQVPPASICRRWNGAAWSPDAPAASRSFIPIFCSTSMDLVQVFGTARDLGTSPAIGESGTHSPTSVLIRLDRHQRRRS